MECFYAAHEFATVSPSYEDAAFGVAWCVAGMDAYARSSGYSHEHRQPTFESRRPSDLELICAGRYATTVGHIRFAVEGCERQFKRVAVPLVVTNDMQRAERAVGEVLQADEFEMHIFRGQQFIFLGQQFFLF